MLEIEIARKIAHFSAVGLEILGIAVIVLVVIYSTIHAGYLLAKQYDRKVLYREYRHRMARGILLGLELLVAADIINTVAVDLSFAGVGVLAIVVLIRTFLSFTLEVEMSGRWPWQQG
jgi:uncharacterized membrane protein